MRHEAWGMRHEAWTPCNDFLINFCQSPVRANQASCLGQIMRIDLQQISKVHKGDKEGRQGGRQEEGQLGFQSLTLSFDCTLSTTWTWLIFNYDKSPSAAQNFIAHWRGEKERERGEKGKGKTSSDSLLSMWQKLFRICLRIWLQRDFPVVSCKLMPLTQWVSFGFVQLVESLTQWKKGNMNMRNVRVNWECCDRLLGLL